MKKLVSITLVVALILSMGLWALAQDAAPADPSTAVDDAAPEVTPDADQPEDIDEWLFEEDEFSDEDFYDEGIFDDISGEAGDMLDEEDTVEDTLLGAMEVYSWFVMQPLDVDLDKPDASGTRFQVLDDRFNTMTQLRGFVSGYFSDELTEELFAMNVYTEEAGFLYTTTDGRNIDETIGETEFEVIDETSDTVTYSVVVHYWGEGIDEEEEFTYVRKLIDGQWKFTEFPFFW